MNNLNDCPIQIDWVVQENIILNTVSKYSFEEVLGSELIEEHQGGGIATLATGVGDQILWWHVFYVGNRLGRIDSVTKILKFSFEIVKWKFFINWINISDKRLHSRMQENFMH